MSHGVFRSDLMTGTDVGADLVSVQYMGEGTTPTAIDNGCVVALNGLMQGEREVWCGVTPKANTALGDIVIIGSVETIYDTKNSLEDFVNKAGKPARGFVPHTKDVFSVTIDALDVAEGSPAVNDVVELTNGVKLAVVKTATEGSTQVGKIIAIERAGKYTFYVIKIN